MKKDDETVDSMFSGDKSSVMQEARAFNESPLNVRKCRIVLTKLLLLMNQLHTNEATETFFSITKLFQSQDIPLRQIVYLAIKELSGIANDVIMITASLTKDINSKTDIIYRPNAIRALCKITDPTMLASIERFLKQAIVDRNPSVSSAALVSALCLYNSASKDIVKRWTNEVQEAINSKGVITQYHAIALLFQIKQNDRMSITKLVQTYSKGLKSTYAHCMLVRYAVVVFQESLDKNTSKAMFDLLESWLRHKNDMVVYEAARAITALPNISQKELFPAVSALQLMLLSSKPTLRFAAIRTLNRLAQTCPVAVWPCNLDMENLITDGNRSIATFAITTLLKTGTEASVDRLMKQITGFMPEISDEFKIIVIDAIRALCLKFPAKQSLMLNFLSNVLRDEGGFEYKRAIVEAIFDIIYHVPESKEYALGHLCEFIEDCEFNKLAVRILHLIGSEGPKTAMPSKYIRYIYNRVILENSTVRAAAVSSLAKFAVACEDLRERIGVLLKRCLDDSDDEVRDRAAMYLRILGVPAMTKVYVGDDSTFAWAALERNIQNYIANPEAHIVAFDISSTPIVTRDMEESERIRVKAAAQDSLVSAPVSPPAGGKPSVVTTTNSIDAQAAIADEISKIPQLAVLGNVLKSGLKAIELTESETEYVVSCTKHVFAKHFVFQFLCRNTLRECLLENVGVAMELQPDEDGPPGMKQIMALTIPKLEFDVPASVWVVWEVVGDCAGTFGNTLKFVAKEIDPSTGLPEEDGYDDEYALEDIDVGLADYMQPLFVGDFRKVWEEYGVDNEVIETYSLTAVQSIKAAVSTVVDLLGMETCEGSVNVKDKASTHTLLLAGSFLVRMEIVKCFVRCRMAFDPASGVTMEICARGVRKDVNERIANCIS